MFEFLQKPPSEAFLPKWIENIWPFGLVRPDKEALAANDLRYQLLAEEQKRAMAELMQEMERSRDLEAQLFQSQKMEAVGRLAGGVSHDFNNLLTVILGYSEMLREHLAEDPLGSEYTAEVHDAASRASALTGQLLAFSRRQTVAPRTVDLNEVVCHIDKMLRRIIGEDVLLETRLTPNLWPVHVDPSQVDQIIMNLAVNSRDAMPLGGCLTIETANVELGGDYAETHFGAKPGSYVMLAMSDTGTGMDAATRARIFEPFFTTKEKGKGTGLGLSIVYGVVKQNGGEIQVYSEVGGGSVFKLYLPAEFGLAKPLPQESEDLIPAASGETVLVVEDEGQVRNLTSTMLMRLGYRVRTAESGRDALSMVSNLETQIDLLLTDMVMPRMSGLDLVKDARVARPGLPALFMSGYTEAGVLQSGMLGADMPFLQKPFTACILQKRVRQALHGVPKV